MFVTANFTFSVTVVLEVAFDAISTFASGRIMRCWLRKVIGSTVSIRDYAAAVNEGFMECLQTFGMCHEIDADTQDQVIKFPNIFLI